MVALVQVTVTATPLGEAVAEMMAVHLPAVRAAVAELRAHGEHLTGAHDGALAHGYEALTAHVTALVAREVRVVAPYLQALDRGQPDRRVFASFAEPLPVVTADAIHGGAAAAALAARLSVATCPTCRAAAVAAAALVTALDRHRSQMRSTVIPLAMARERALAGDEGVPRSARAPDPAPHRWSESDGSEEVSCSPSPLPARSSSEEPPCAWSPSSG